MKTDKEKLEIAKKALAFYARRYAAGKCWNWGTVSDDDNTNYHTFDYDGDVADWKEPWKFAEKALKELED